MRFRTETGSVYEILPEEKRWKRLSGTTRNLRTEGGFYQACSEPEIGEPVIITGESLTAGGIVRLITTSRVIAIEGQAAAPPEGPDQ